MTFSKAFARPIPRSLRRLVQSAHLVEILPEHTAAPMPVSIVHAHGRRVPVRVRVVMDWLSEVVTPTLY